MKVLMVNSVCGIRSTGRICTDLAAALEAQGHEVKIAYGRESVPERAQKYAVRIGSEMGVKVHALRARLLDDSGFGSKAATCTFLKWVEEYDPDVIHLHNIHGYYLNVEELFGYLHRSGKRVIWTLHDCWAFTGHAAYCDAANCEKWKTGCSHCPKRDDYPKSFLDFSARNWRKKKALFTSLAQLEIVTPSHWLARLAGESFLGGYPISVIHNGINTSVFQPTESDVRLRYQAENKKLILGVAAVWDGRKGLNDFVALHEKLGDQARIVLVGLSDEQIHSLPAGMIGIQRTNSPAELAELYSAADFFVNPTYDDNYPTTNLEAISCGTPVLSYDTGGSGESACLYGCMVKKGDVDALAALIQNPPTFIRHDGDLDTAACIAQYLALYQSTKTATGEKRL